MLEIGKMRVHRVQYADRTNLSCICIGNRDIRIQDLMQIRCRRNYWHKASDQTPNVYTSWLYSGSFPHTPQLSHNTPGFIS